MSLRFICDLPHRWSPRHWMGLTCLLAVLVAIVGCAESTVPNDNEGEELRQLTVLYSQYAAMNGGTGPADEATFKEFISQQPDEFDVDAMFVSERDQQPYVIFYGKTSNLPSPELPPNLLAYEKVGVDGKRYVGMGGGVVEIVGEERFKELLPEGPTSP